MLRAIRYWTEKDSRGPGVWRAVPQVTVSRETGDFRELVAPRGELLDECAKSGLIAAFRCVDERLFAFFEHGR
jgi:hypothetical protein